MVKPQKEHVVFDFKSHYSSCSSAGFISKSIFLLMVCLSLYNLTAAPLLFLLFSQTDVTHQDRCGREGPPLSCRKNLGRGAILWNYIVLQVLAALICLVKLMNQLISCWLKGKKSLDVLLHGPGVSSPLHPNITGENLSCKKGEIHLR